MGGLAQIFGGGPSYSAPEPIQTEPLPAREAAVEPASKAARDEERRRLQARRAMGGTLLTNPLGRSLNSGGTSLGGGQ